MLRTCQRTDDALFRSQLVTEGPPEIDRCAAFRLNERPLDEDCCGGGYRFRFVNAFSRGSSLPSSRVDEGH